MLSTVAPVDEVLPAPKLAALGFQHVLVMYAAKLPSQLGPILNSGILLAAISAVVLNLYFNGAGSIAKAPREAQGAL